MPSRSLPSRPNLTQLKLQADELRRSHRERKRSAAARIVAHHPRMKGQPLEAVLDRSLALADAQLVVAREYGFENWARLKHYVRDVSPARRVPSASTFRRSGRRARCRRPRAAAPAASGRNPR